MVHLQPLPGTPFHRGVGVEQILATAVESARALRDGGASGCLVQTVDRVYAPGEETDPARIAALSLIVRAVVEATGPGFEVGVQLMRTAARASLAVAKVAGGSFVRVSALVGATMTASGLVQADPLGVMEYRSKINAWDVKIIADVASMHYQWFGGGKDVGEVAQSARQAGADAVAVGAPDESETLDLIARVRAAAPHLPIILAGYTHHGNAAQLLAADAGADGAFVGTCLESEGWGSAIDVEKVKTYMQLIGDAP
ncbi:BtpA/SgcQ family protein [Nonomuraea turkmeniaca]|nr:BtpA/SgcQ family protein [Nonomuraea turkmeniaca]